MQVLLVTGGEQGGGDFISLNSTEVLEGMAGTWRLTAPLPFARWELRAASVDNSILLFGENILHINIDHLIVSIMFIMTIYLQEEKRMTGIVILTSSGTTRTTSGKRSEI